MSTRSASSRQRDIEARLRDLGFRIEVDLGAHIEGEGHPVFALATGEMVSPEGEVLELATEWSELESHATRGKDEASCTCPSGDGSLRWPCPSHPPQSVTLEPGMVEVRTTELVGRALDAAVALALGGTDLRYDTVCTWIVTLDGKDRALSNGWAPSISFAPSTEWMYGGPIIDQFGVGTERRKPGCWLAIDEVGLESQVGTTALIAAMRCVVASRLGPVVKLPAALVKS